MKRCLFLIFMLLARYDVWSQEVISQKDTGTLSFAEYMPQFRGGEKAMETYFRSNTIYPTVSNNKFKSGKETVSNSVIVSFVVGVSGSLTDIKVENKPTNEYANEAVRLIRNMPLWRPATNNGKAVAMKMCIPVLFK